jgi:flavin reductase (DIM6/NTAB) family NADH-FMN oxidoreductase RutF
MKTVSIDITKLSPNEAYKILAGSVLPRPIAWVSTISAQGNYNLAPFSFFNAIASNPPTLLFCPVTPEKGKEKDTLRNIRETKQFVVNFVSEELVQKMNMTSGEYPPELSEFEIAGLTPIAGVQIKAPRVLESPIQFECELLQIIQVGNGDEGSGNIVIGKLLHAHVQADAINERHHIDVLKIKPVGRLAGNDYCPFREIFSIKRPIV